MKKILAIVFALCVGIALAAPIRSMLGSRGGEFVESEKEPPYPLPDGVVAVEYLESTANSAQRILIDDIECSALGVSYSITESYQNTTKRQLWGNLPTGWFFGINASGKYEINSTAMNFNVLPDTPITFSISFNRVSGVNLIASYSVESESNIFRNTSYSYPRRDGALSLFTLQNSASYCTAGHRVFSATVAMNGAIVHDLVPVRFLNENNEDEGGLYDYVTGELYRNQGTGSFIIGPDVQ